MKLSIIIPAFNEEETIQQILKEVDALKINGVKKEVIVVDDASSDTTSQKVENWVKGKKDFKFLKHKKNQGKGAAVITGIKSAKGDYIIIQDADLEYHPKYIKKLFLPILNKQTDVVYGTRLNRLPNFLKEEKSFRFILHYFGNRFLSLLTSVLYGHWITDRETCYKLFPRNIAVNFKLNARGFEFEPEITAKLLKSGCKVKEVSINVVPRGYEEGKKLNTFRDGRKALWAILKYRFVN